MNLHGSIRGLQKRLSQLYLKLGQRFSENNIIRDVWNAMQLDVSRQISSLDVLPPSFWNQMRKLQDGLLQSIGALSKMQTYETKEDGSLKSCFEQALAAEEPTILKIYVPIIRSLRDNWNERALDFYIMVKAHLARIVNVTQAFAGDPLLIHRSNLLLQNFEKEVQEQPPPPAARSASKPAAGEAAVVQKKPAKRVQSAGKKSHSLIRRAKMRSARPKPILRKVSLPRRRARQ